LQKKSLSYQISTAKSPLLTLINIQPLQLDQKTQPSVKKKLQSNLDFRYHYGNNHLKIV